MFIKIDFDKDTATVRFKDNLDVLKVIVPSMPKSLAIQDYGFYAAYLLSLSCDDLFPKGFEYIECKNQSFIFSKF